MDMPPWFMLIGSCVLGYVLGIAVGVQAERTGLRGKQQQAITQTEPIDRGNP